MLQVVVNNYHGNLEMESESKKARTVKANHLLQAKVGSGPLDEKLVKRSQKLIDNNDVDFAPLAKEFIDQLTASIAEARAGDSGKDAAAIIQDMIDPVMQIKANAKMFDYELVGNLANIMLNFLETVEELDKDVLEIVEAHQKTLVVIIGNEMKGDGGSYGQELAGELKDACKRYFSKQINAGKSIEDKDAFFIDG